MSSVELNEPEVFGREFLDAYLNQGFQSVSKRDIDLLIFLLLERDGAIERSASNFDVARRLRITPGKVKALRRDAYARWRPLVGSTRDKQLEGVLRAVLTPDKLDASAKHGSSQGDGFLAIRVEHPDDRAELEQAILEAGGLPEYGRNRELLYVRFESLIALADSFDIGERDAKKVRKTLKKLAPKVETVQEFLSKDLSEVSWSDARAALNAAGSAAVANGIDSGVLPLLRVVFPFLP